MNTTRRQLFKRLGAALLALPLAGLLAFRRKPERFDLMGFGESYHDPHGVLSYPNYHKAGYFHHRYVFREVPLTRQEARQLRADGLSDLRSQVARLRKDLDEAREELFDLHDQPLPETTLRSVEVFPGDPDYGDITKYAGEYRWLNHPSPWLDLIGEK